MKHFADDRDRQPVGQLLARRLQLPQRPLAGPGVPGAWFDVLVVLTISPFTGWVLGMTAVGAIDLLLGVIALGLFGGFHAAWLRTFPA